MSRRLRDVWARFARRGIPLVGLVVLVALTMLAVFADVVAPHSPIHQYRDARLLPPVWQSGGSPRFPLGTDAVGRDLLSRVIHGSRLSLLSGLVVVALAFVAGVTLGVVAGAAGGITAAIILRTVDVILALPSLLLALVVIVMLGDGLLNAMLAIAVVSLPHLVRLTRAAVLTELGKDYVTAARAVGAGTPRLFTVVVLPNCVAPLIVQTTLSFSSAILSMAALGFLGLGAQPPTPEWGTMLAEAREFVLRAWWVVTFPGLALLVTVLAVNVLGDGLRDALDPKLTSDDAARRA